MTTPDTIVDATDRINAKRRIVGLPTSFEATIESVSEQVESLKTQNDSLVEEKELLHEQIAAAQKRQRAIERKVVRNEKEIEKLVAKKRIASRAAREILDLDME